MLNSVVGVSEGVDWCYAASSMEREKKKKSKYSGLISHMTSNSPEIDFLTVVEVL